MHGFINPHSYSTCIITTGFSEILVYITVLFVYVVTNFKKTAAFHSTYLITTTFYFSFEVFMTVITKDAVLWDVAMCWSC
jgi:hypothetical protein